MTPRCARALPEHCAWLQTCVGSDTAGEWAATPDGSAKRYLHSPSSLQSLLQHIGFAQVHLMSLSLC